jgi:hypothetical protein
MVEMRNANKTLVGKPERRRPFKRPRYRQEEEIKMDVWEVEREDVDWLHLV